MSRWIVSFQAAPTGFLARAGEFFNTLFSVSPACAADLLPTSATDGNGEFRVAMIGFLASFTATIQAGNSSRMFSGTELGGGSSSPYAFDFTGSPTSPLPSYADGATPASLMQTATVRVKVSDASNNPVANKAVTWQITYIADNESAVHSARRGFGHGLAGGGGGRARFPFL